jgi:hypothetical protein
VTINSSIFVFSALGDEDAVAGDHEDVSEDDQFVLG